MTNPLDIIAAAKARRVAAGLVSTDGIACPTQEYVEYTTHGLLNLVTMQVAYLRRLP